MNPAQPVTRSGFSDFMLARAQTVGDDEDPMYGDGCSTVAIKNATYVRNFNGAND
jgi:hypothetical protein